MSWWGDRGIIPIFRPINTVINPGPSFSRPQHYWYFRQGNASLWGAVLFITSYLTASLAFLNPLDTSSTDTCRHTHRLVTARNVSWGTKPSLLESTVFNISDRRSLGDHPTQLLHFTDEKTEAQGLGLETRFPYSG